MSPQQPPTSTSVSSSSPPQQPNLLKVAKERMDAVVLMLTAMFLGGLFLLSGVALDIGLIIFFAIVLGGILFYIRLFQIGFLGNALRVQSGKHAHLLEMVNEISATLAMPTVDVFITQDPYLNAFAVGYHHPYTIVLHSATVDELTPDELKAVLVHEMGHIKYKHTIITAYTQPMSVLVPVLGPIVAWSFGFWSRRAELTCDRLATAYVGSPHTVASALMKIHVGSKFAAYLTEEGVYQQDVYSKGTMRQLSQSLSTHPFLVTRVREVMEFAKRSGIVQ